MKKWLYTLSVALAVALTTPGVAAAADLGGSGPREYVEAPASYKDWTGIYAGFLIGYSTADFGFDSNTSIYSGQGEEGPIFTDFPLGFGSDSSEINFGVQLGADVQYGMVVLGAVADFSWMGLESGGTTDVGEALFGPEASDEVFLDHEFGLEYLATARLRAGALLHPSVLAYVTGGVAFGNVEFDARVRGNDVDECCINFGSDTQRWGYTVGAGVEAKLTENIRAKVEYLYVDLGEAEYNVNAVSGGQTFADHKGSIEVDLHLVRAGLAYQF